MIQKVEMYTVICDNCKIDAAFEDEYSCWSEINFAVENAKDCDWIEEDDKHYCPKCYSYDDEDNLVINTERTKL
jgi:hypothetical protein